MRLPTNLLIALSLLVLAVVSEAAEARESGDARAESKQTAIKQSRPVIEFGHEGGNLRPYRVAIYADGRVKALKGAPSLKAQSVPAEKVTELVSRATDRKFWKRGRIEKRPALPDFGFAFVRVRTQSGRIIYHHGPQTGPLGEYYSALSDLVLAKP